MLADDGELLLAGDSALSFTACFLRRFGIAMDDDICARRICRAAKRTSTRSTKIIPKAEDKRDK